MPERPGGVEIAAIVSESIVRVAPGGSNAIVRSSSFPKQTGGHRKTCEVSRIPSGHAHSFLFACLLSRCCAMSHCCGMDAMLLTA
jgi:hypothetical protein